ncbi:MAG: GntR family transcriptional regulator [Chloroflexi bacterium]|nr:GntR family transcriptional regulator [Chloroflexota bacterium]
MRVQRPKPITEQVSDILRQRLRNREYPPGSRMPSESELALELGVSRATVRTVMAKFATEGLILRKQGDGTYVNERIRDVDFRYGGIWDFSRLIEDNGYTHSIKTLLVEERNPTQQEAQALGLDGNTAVINLQRLFMANNQPAICTNNAISRSFIDVNIDLTQFNSQLPIHKLLQEYCHQDIAYAITDIEAKSAAAPINAVLRRSADTPLLQLTETFYDKVNQPLVFGISYFDQAILRLRLVQAWG